MVVRGSGAEPGAAGAPGVPGGGGVTPECGGMPPGTPGRPPWGCAHSHAGVSGLCGHVGHINQFDVEDEIGFCGMPGWSAPWSGMARIP